MRRLPDWFPLVLLAALYLLAAGVAPPIDMLMGLVQ